MIHGLLQREEGRSQAPSLLAFSQVVCVAKKVQMDSNGSKVPIHFVSETATFVERPDVDRGPMVGGRYSLRKRATLLKSPSKSSETQDTLKAQAG